MNEKLKECSDEFERIWIERHGNNFLQKDEDVYTSDATFDAYHWFEEAWLKWSRSFDGHVYISDEEYLSLLKLKQ